MLQLNNHNIIRSSPPSDIQEVSSSSKFREAMEHYWTACMHICTTNMNIRIDISPALIHLSLSLSLSLCLSLSLSHTHSLSLSLSLSTWHEHNLVSHILVSVFSKRIPCRYPSLCWFCSFLFAVFSSFFLFSSRPAFTCQRQNFPSRPPRPGFPCPIGESFSNQIQMIGCSSVEAFQIIIRCFSRCCCARHTKASAFTCMIDSFSSFS